MQIFFVARAGEYSNSFTWIDIWRNNSKSVSTIHIDMIWRSVFPLKVVPMCVFLLICSAVPTSLCLFFVSNKLSCFLLLASLHCTKLVFFLKQVVFNVLDQLRLNSFEVAQEVPCEHKHFILCPAEEQLVILHESTTKIKQTLSKIILSDNIAFEKSLSVG